MRFSEDINGNISADFLPRRYFAPLRRVLPFYLAGLLLVAAALQLSDLIGTQGTVIAAFAFITIICAFAYFQLQQSSDLTMASDFQNMLFAGAASLGSSFCFFLRQNGTIVYANEGTRNMFPNFAKSQDNGLDLLFSEAQLSNEDLNRFFSALSKGKKESLIFNMRGANQEAKDHIVIIQPLMRPAGYFVVHGRPFSAQRQGTQKLPGVLGNTRLDKIEALLDTLPIGVYLTSETGLIEYVNPMLEKLLGYDPRGFTDLSHPIGDLVYHADGYETGEFELVDYSGNALLSCRNQSLSRVFLDQRKIPDEKGGIKGVMGIVTPVS